MVQYETKTEWAASQLRKAITAGRIQPGERMRIQDWADRLDISATPLREAFKVLEGEGYLEITPHRGAQVKPFNSNEFAISGRISEELDAIAAEEAALHMAPEERSGLVKRLARLNEQ